MQVEPETGQTAYMQVEPDTGQIAYTPRWQKTGSAMQDESRDPQSYPIQTAYTPTGSGMQIESLDPRSHLIQTACTPPSMATQQQEEDGLTALPSLQLKPTYMPDDDGARPISGHAVAQQMEKETAVEKELSMLQLEDTVNRFLPEQQVHDFRQKPETEELRNNLSYREEPLTKPEIEIEGEESLPSDKDNLAHDDVPEQQYQKWKTETDAKAGTTRHLSRYPDGMSGRATNAADAKVGQTQHSLVDRSLRHAKNKLVDVENRDKETGQQQRNDRPEGNHTRRPDKTCIWIEYL